jgi:hypothetical protein
MAFGDQKNTGTETSTGIGNRTNEVQTPDKSLLRQIDWRILPIMFLAYFLQFLDKVVLNVGVSPLLVSLGN